MKPNEKPSDPKIHHICVVVKDMEKAIQYYSKRGISPFLVRETDKGHCILKWGFAWLVGSMRLELVQVLGGHCIYNEFLDKHGEGTHHICFEVEDGDGEVALWKKRGFRMGPGGPGWGFVDFGYNVIIEFIARVITERKRYEPYQK